VATPHESRSPAIFREVGPDPRNPDPVRDASTRFAELTDRLVEVLNTFGELGPEGDNAPFDPSSGPLQTIRRRGIWDLRGQPQRIESGQLADEDLDLIAEVETWAARSPLGTGTPG
jgi:hypothetical protein